MFKRKKESSEDETKSKKLSMEKVLNSDSSTNYETDDTFDSEKSNSDSDHEESSEENYEDSERSESNEKTDSSCSDHEEDNSIASVVALKNSSEEVSDSEQADKRINQPIATMQFSEALWTGDPFTLGAKLLQKEGRDILEKLYENVKTSAPKKVEIREFMGGLLILRPKDFSATVSLPKDDILTFHLINK